MSKKAAKKQPAKKAAYRMRKAAPAKKYPSPGPSFLEEIEQAHQRGFAEGRLLEEQAYKRGFSNGRDEEQSNPTPRTERDPSLAASWRDPADAVTPGLYLCQGQEGKGVALRLTYTSSGPNRTTLHWSDENGSVVGDHCLKRVYGPIEEDTSGA